MAFAQLGGSIMRVSTSVDMHSYLIPSRGMRTTAMC
jgi:hypothetical protein